MAEAGAGGEDGTKIETTGADGPIGLGGWLILPLIGLAMTPFYLAYISRDFLLLGDSWAYLTTPQKVFIVVEIVANLSVFLAAPVALLVFAFKRLEIFPGLYMIWIGLIPIVVLLDAMIGYWVFQEAFAATGEPMFDKDTTRSLSRSIGQAVIWIAYMIRSERVENTFVN
jgi:hypothetical protein